MFNKVQTNFFVFLVGLYGLPARTGKLKDLASFDATFFGVHAKQAEKMDPQLRLLLETTHETIVDAGFNPAELRGSRTGVYIGVSSSEAEEFWLTNPDHVDGYALTGCCRAMFPNRISFSFHFTGKLRTSSLMGLKILFKNFYTQEEILEIKNSWGKKPGMSKNILMPEKNPENLNFY